MEAPQLYARLDKSKKRVLCAVRDCGGQLGDMILQPSDDGVPQRYSRMLRLPPGWAKRNDGIYHLTKYARDKIKGVRPPKLRCRPDGTRSSGMGLDLFRHCHPLLNVQSAAGGKYLTRPA